MSDPTNDPTAAPKGERLAKRIARAGLCSRREAERWIEAGRVEVNRAKVTSPATLVTEADQVRVDGQALAEPEAPRLWRYHKPSGQVTTARDPEGRPTVFEALPAEMPRVVSVGRLDLTSEGLLLLTNDGELARYLEHPSTGWRRRYRARVHGTVDEARLSALAEGITVSGIAYGPIEAALDRVQGSNAWLTVGLSEGRNREVRRVLEALGLTVTRLIRLSYGPFHLGNLPAGAVDEVKPSVLKDQLRRFFQGERPPAPGSRPAARPGRGARDARHRR